MDLKRCDVKDCGLTMEAGEHYEVCFLDKDYDLCSECYETIQDWILKTLDGGRELEEEEQETTATITVTPDAQVQPGPWYPVQYLNTDDYAEKQTNPQIGPGTVFNPSTCSGVLTSPVKNLSGRQRSLLITRRGL